MVRSGDSSSNWEEEVAGSGTAVMPPLPVAATVAHCPLGSPKCEERNYAGQHLRNHVAARSQQGEQ
jgi:hypothetical protein